jgi:hypothetical protein
MSNILPEHNPKNGSGHPYNGKNYKQVSLPGHPQACDKDGLMYEHRYLAAKALGKPIPRGAEVHHHGGVRIPGQLVLCENKAYHRLLHIREKAYAATGDPSKRKCPFCHQWDATGNMISYNHNELPSERFLHRACKQKYERGYTRKRPG